MIEEEYTDEQLERSYQSILSGEKKSKLVASVNFRLAGEQGFLFMAERLTNGCLAEKHLALEILATQVWPDGFDIAALLPHVLVCREQSKLPRIHVVRFLWRFTNIYQSEAGLELLREHLFEENAETRKMTIDALGELRDTQSIPMLATLLDDEERVSLSAQNALRSIGSPYARFILEEWRRRQ